MLQPYINFFQNPDVISTLNIVYYTSFIWIPGFILYLLWDLWVQYRRAIFFAKTSTVLLEIKLPREIFKSPQAAEFFISGLGSTVGEKNWYEKYWKGQVRIHSSLEIVSIDGQIHFFIWTRKSSKNQLEANLYSQYPGIEVHEVADYTLPVVYDPETLEMWVGEFALLKEDVFPIKTYIDYGLDKDPEEEYKIDPLTPLIEALGSIGKGHQSWIQIIIRQHKAEDKDPITGEKVDLRWAKDAQKQIDKILANTKGEKGEDGKLIPGSNRRLTDVESDTIKALGRSISKKGFDVGIRGIYSAPKDIFNPANIGGIVASITHFNSSMNGFKPVRMSESKYEHGPFAWMNRMAKTRIKEKQDMLDAYKRRAYYYKPFKRPHFVLNTEELATLFHFPGGVSSTPTFTRVESKKSDAPSNLPI